MRKITILLVALAVAFASAAYAQTTAFTYQGKLVDDCCPATGLYDLTFKVFDSAGPGASGQQGGTVTKTATPVTNGLFTVSLDFGSAPFTGARRWLQIDARTNNPALTPVALLPRTELTPTPYAVYAGKAGNVTNGAIQASQLGTSGAPSPGQVLGYNGSSLVWQTGVGSGPWALNGSSAYYNGGNVGIGTTTPNGQLHVRTTDTSGGIRIGGGNGAGNARVFIEANGDNSYIDSYGDDAFKNLAIQARSLLLNTAAGSGNVGIGTTAPESKLEVRGGNIHIYGGGGTLYFQGGPSDPYYLLETYSTPDAAGMRLLGYSGVKLSTGQGDIVNVVHDKVGIGTPSPKTQLHIAGDYYGRGHIYLYAYEGGDGQNGNAYVQARDDSGTSSIGMVLRTQRNGTIRNAIVMDPDGNATVNGTLTTCVLTITGGCDLAEPFPMTTKDIPKGSVVVIDEENPGQLKLSDRAYDTRVAGILSGANGIKPGLSLNQAGVLDTGEHVALTGRVYVQADAAHGSIKPGDLLTTSATPGHAMKVTDRDRAQGAILGKAMTGLKEGKGMVLVLVSLQ